MMTTLLCRRQSVKAEYYLSKIFAGARFARASNILWVHYSCADFDVRVLAQAEQPSSPWAVQKFSLALASLAPAVFYEDNTPVQTLMCEWWRKHSSLRLCMWCKNFRWRSLRSRQLYYALATWMWGSEFWAPLRLEPIPFNERSPMSRSTDRRLTTSQ